MPTHPEEVQVVPLGQRRRERSTEDLQSTKTSPSQNEASHAAPHRAPSSGSITQV
ncbi:MAG: hypothetical protein M5U28_40260 [Sandaracinaceae bacterium]|nr:hypothetical protein [Sandaracinaceae bacterium]